MIQPSISSLSDAQRRRADIGAWFRDYAESNNVLGKFIFAPTDNDGVRTPVPIGYSAAYNKVPIEAFFDSGRDFSFQGSSNDVIVSSSEMARMHRLVGGKDCFGQTLDSLLRVGDQYASSFGELLDVAAVVSCATVADRRVGPISIVPFYEKQHALIKKLLGDFMGETQSFLKETFPGGLFERMPDLEMLEQVIEPGEVLFFNSPSTLEWPYTVESSFGRVFKSSYLKEVSLAQTPDGRTRAIAAESLLGLPCLLPVGFSTSLNVPSDPSLIRDLFALSVIHYDAMPVVEDRHGNNSASSWHNLQRRIDSVRSAFKSLNALNA